MRRGAALSDFSHHAIGAVRALPEGAGGAVSSRMEGDSGGGTAAIRDAGVQWERIGAGERLVVVPSATTMLHFRSAVWIRKPAAAARPYPIVPSSGWFSFLVR